MTGRLRWVARLVLVVPLVIAWFIAIGNVVNDPSSDFEGVALFLGLIVTSAVAVMVWFRERLGGVMLIGLAAVAWLFAYLASTPNNVGAGVLFMLPWLVSGVLFLLVGQLEQRKPE